LERDIGFRLCGSEVVQAELASDEGGDDEGGGRVEVEVEEQLLVERLHRGGWQRRRWAGGAAGREGRTAEARGRASWAGWL
jgi:hypothetical protein